MAADQRFRRGERLTLRKSFAQVFALRCRRSDTAMTIFVADNGLTWSRLGISVSRRVGNAVKRNRIRRRIREAFRLSKTKMPLGVDIVCIARSPAAEKSWDVAQSLVKLVSTATNELRPQA